MELIPYIMFNGNAEEALNFYQKSLGGEVLFIQRYKESELNEDKSIEEKVMHAQFVFGNNSSFMASDALPNHPATIGNNVQLSIDFKSPADQKKCFEALAEGGKVAMPLQDTFWGARFGMLQDKYGINWMFNCDIEP